MSGLVKRFLCLMSTIVAAGIVDAAEYSADIVEQGPQGVMARARVYVSGKRTRTETTRKGTEIVTITDDDVRKQWTLFPADHAYIERSGSIPRSKPEDPCSGLPGASCERLGEERLWDRPVTKWQVTADGQGDVSQSYHWIDTERGIVLRQVMPDGSRTEWRRVGLDRIENRHVEKWQVVMDRLGLPPVQMFNWIDPELNVAIREEMPGGFVSELRNIHIGAAPEEMFRVPIDYREVVRTSP